MDSNTFYFGPLILSGSTFQSADTSSAAQYVGELTGSVQGTASYAVVADVAAVAYQANTASYALYAISASYEINKELSSSYADTASFAATASRAITASYATTSNSSISSQYSSTAETADFATTSTTAQTASFVATASRAITSSYAVSALTASYALSSAGGGGGGTSPTYFVYSGSHQFSTSWQSINIPTAVVTVDSTKEFRLDFWGFQYFADDFYGETYDNQGAVYGQPVTIWSKGWDGTKMIYNLGTSNKNSGYLYQVRLNYSGTGNQLQFQWKASGNMVMPFIVGVGATLTYL
jgi:hypothetical protein